MLYVLEIMKAGDACQILKTNLKPFFWEKVEKILRQNKKKLLLDFLFGSHSTTDAESEKQFKALEKDLNSLQKKIIYLENQNRKIEAHLTMLSAAPRSSKFDTSIRSVTSRKEVRFPF